MNRIERYKQVAPKEPDENRRGAFPNFCKLFVPEGLLIIAKLFIAG